MSSPQFGAARPFGFWEPQRPPLAGVPVKTGLIAAGDASGVFGGVVCDPTKPWLGGGLSISHNVILAGTLASGAVGGQGGDRVAWGFRAGFPSLVSGFMGGMGGMTRVIQVTRIWRTCQSDMGDTGVTYAWHLGWGRQTSN